MIVFIFTSILALLFIFLSIGVIKQRRILGVALGDGDSLEIKKWVSAHNNFIQYTPFVLLMMFFIETSGGAKIEIFVIGVFFTVGRFFHAYGLTKEEVYKDGKLDKLPKSRIKGMKITFFIILYCAFRLLHLNIVSF
jgi:uncharacterized membrane protein YecN with MAPEG domain